MGDYCTIMPQDVGARTVPYFGRKWRVEDFIERIMPQDIGKRVYLVGDILQVENKEQFEARWAKRGQR